TSLLLYSRANGWPESSSRFVLIVNTSAAPIRPPRTRGGTNVSREHPVNNRPPSAGTLVSHVRREMRLIIAASFLGAQTVYRPVIIERTLLKNPAAATSST